MLEDLCRLKVSLGLCLLSAEHHNGEAFWTIGPNCHSPFLLISFPTLNLLRGWTEELLQLRSINSSTGLSMWRRSKPLKPMRGGGSQIIVLSHTALSQGPLYLLDQGLLLNLLARIPTLPAALPHYLKRSNWFNNRRARFYDCITKYCCLVLLVFAIAIY